MSVSKIPKNAKISSAKGKGISAEASVNQNKETIKKTEKQKRSVDMDEILNSAAHLVTLNDFIQEKNTSKALTFWLETLSSEQPKTVDDISYIIQNDIVAIDQKINQVLNNIIHQEKFQQLESAWRGLWYLALQADGIRDFKLKCLDITWLEITKDIERALEFDQSQLFQKIYNEEYGTPGGEPYGTIICDYSVNHKLYPTDDISTLNGLAEVAAAAFSPMILAASSEFFGLDDYSELSHSINLHNVFSQTEYIKWRSLREKTDSRFIGLTLPSILMRKPYRKTPGSYKGIFFHEQTHNKNDYLWGSAAYAFAAILIREFSQIGWFGHIRGVPRNQIGGGLIASLTTDSFDCDSHQIIKKSVTDVVITDSLEKDISSLGFIPLCQCYDLPFAAFYNNPSIQNLNRQRNVNEINVKLSGMMQHVLCASRIAHYIKVMIRDKVGSFVTAEECENHLQNWLFKYTTGNEDLEWEEQARYPLKHAAVSVKEHPDKPGQYSCIIKLVPHYQLDQMVSELELVTELVRAS